MLRPLPCGLTAVGDRRPSRGAGGRPRLVVPFGTARPPTCVLWKRPRHNLTLARRRQIQLSDRADKPGAGAHSGVLISRGTSVRIPIGGLRLTLNPDGSVQSSQVQIEVSLDFTSHWMRIAIAHLANCEESRRRHLAIDNKDGAVIGPLLEAECEAGMVAILAAATSIDAFYAMLKDRSQRVASIPVSRGRRSARHKIVFEAIRREFRFGASTQAQMRLALSELYKFRGWSVHPSSSFNAPVPHPDLPSLVEWRVAAFRYGNAQKAVRIALSLLVQLSPFLRNKDSEVGKAVLGAQPIFDELAVSWRARFGPLLDADRESLESAG